MGDALRLAFGTLTVLRVPAPRRVDRTVGGRAMLLAPLVGLLLGVIAAAVGVVADALGLSALPVAVVVVGTLALLTRGLHLDGLADTADGLGSGRSGAEALEVMKRSDIGPFGVVTVVLVVLAEIAALTQVWQADRAVGAAAVVVAAVASRAVLPLLCRTAIPAARAEGLGATVAGTVRGGGLLTALAVTLVLVAVVGAIGQSVAEPATYEVGWFSYESTLTSADGLPSDPGAGSGAWEAVVAAAAGLALVGVLAQRAVRRFGGVTGDVLGAGVELAFAATLLVLAALT